MSGGQAGSGGGQLVGGRFVGGQFAVAFEHRIYFEEGVLAAGNVFLPDLLGEGARLAAIVDSGVAHLIPRLVAMAGERLQLAKAPLVVSPDVKGDLDRFFAMVRYLHDCALDRHAYVMVVGGGAVLDAAGFAAGIVHRGLRVVRLPTTVLCQNDAGVGVKTAIDAFGKKNFLGSFTVPWAVVNDFSLLAGLPAERLREGTIEAVKVGLIRDAAFYDWMVVNAGKLAALDESAFRYLIRRCAELHVEHIVSGGDPFERGSARPLDFGHWAAHKLEQMTGFTLSHGQAVAIGIEIDTLYADRMGIAAGPEVRRGAVDCLRTLGFAEKLPIKVNAAELLAGIDEFREHLGGRLSITMVVRPGLAVEVGELDRQIMRQCAEQVIAERGKV